MPLNHLLISVAKGLSALVTSFWNFSAGLPERALAKRPMPTEATSKKGLNALAVVWVRPSRMLERAPANVCDCLSIMPPKPRTDLVPFSRPLMIAGTARLASTSPELIMSDIFEVVTP
jgi:hypothetical protein